MNELVERYSKQGSYGKFASANWNKNQADKVLGALMHAWQAVSIALDILRLQLQNDEELASYPQIANYIEQDKIKNFIQRKQITQQISDALKNDPPTCVLHGFGGTGKSTIAIHYGHSRKDQMKVRLLRSEDQNKLQQDFESLAAELQIKFKQVRQCSRSQHEYYQNLARKVYKVLGKRQTLIIFDNARDPDLLQDFMTSKANSVQVIITTRDFFNFYNSGRYNGQIFEIAAYTRDEAKQYVENQFQQMGRQYDVSDIERLLDTVGMLPLKLSIAMGNLYSLRELSVDDYVKKLNQQTRSRQKLPKLSIPDVAIGLETLGFKEQQIMRFVSFLDPDYIPFSLISRLLDEEDKSAISAMIVNLKRQSLVHFLQKDQCYQTVGIYVHREIQASCRLYSNWKRQNWLSRSKLDQEIIKREIDVLHQNMPILSENPTIEWEYGKVYAPHVVKVLNIVQQTEGSQSLSPPVKVSQIMKQKAVQLNIINLMARIAQYFKEVQNNYQLRLEYHLRALKLRQILHRMQMHVDVADSLTDVGIAYETLGQLQQALQYYEDALNMRKQLLQYQHIDIAKSLNQLGQAHRILGNLDSAQKNYYESLKIKQEVYNNQDHASIALGLNNVGVVYDMLGKTREGMSYKLMSLQMRQRLNPGNHPAVARSLDSIGLAHRNMNEYDKFLDYALQSFNMRKELYGSDHLGVANPHVDVAHSLNSVGDAYGLLGDYQNCLKYNKQALQMRQSIFQDEHNDVAHSLNTVGLCLSNLGKHQQGLQHMQSALDMYKSIFQGNHQDIALTLNNMGKVLVKLGQPQQALDCHKQATLSLKKKKNGRAHV
eukprot:TRINITY_DN2642_c0_g1_i5.p1 TRINITY_DN2642_c0_g1~~TRINITY_DN2642_c0_g1_i5.p1  ORF type:complete len:941 (-),score=36.38 TRINITY_DN2642_c0_g1_i5:33-2510(-)